MENTRGGSNSRTILSEDWTKEHSEELVLLYLEDYYRTLDDSFLKEAMQITKDERLDIQKIMHRAKLRMA
jgi:hypothetical protein